MFAGFQKDRDGVVRLDSGSLGTFTSTTFTSNFVSSPDPDIIAAGPVAGLKADGISQAAAVWFQGCVFKSNTGAVPGDVAVESRQCRVYSNTVRPTVWDLERSQEINPWLLVPRDDMSTSGEDVFEGRAFPTESDAFFTRIVEQQAAASGLFSVVPRALPAGTTFTTQDPYASASDTIWTGQKIALIVGLPSALTILAIGVLLWYFYYFKPEGDTGPLPVRGSCSVPWHVHNSCLLAEFIFCCKSL